jgi:DNA-binding MarR family transcriptional regulator
MRTQRVRRLQRYLDDRPADGYTTAVCGSAVPIVNQVYSLLTSCSVDISGIEQLADTDGGSQRERSVGLGPALRRAWIGYQRRLDMAMADTGFDERRFPDSRVLRLCSDSAGSTISNIGRELGITRQGAAKVVGHLHDRGYVSVADSPTSGREKAVTLTVSGTRYLEVQREAVRTIERQLRKELGEEPLTALHRLLDVLDPGEEVRMRTYLSSRTTGLSPDDAPKRRDPNR